MRPQQGQGLHRVGTGSGRAGAGSLSHPTLHPGAGQPGALCLGVAGEWQCFCSSAGTGAPDPKEGEMGSWDVGGVGAGADEGTRSQVV